VLVDTGGAEAVGRSELQNDAIGIEHHQETPRLQARPCSSGFGLWIKRVYTETLSLTGYLEH